MELTNHQPLLVGEIMHASNWPLANFQMLDEMRYFSNKYPWIAEEIIQFGRRILQVPDGLPTEAFPGWSEREILAAPLSELIERANAEREVEMHHQDPVIAHWNEWTEPKQVSWLDGNSIYDPMYKAMMVAVSVFAYRDLWAKHPAQRKYLIAELVGLTTLAVAGIISGDISLAASSPISTHIGTAMLLTYFPLKHVFMNAIGNRT